MMPSRLESVNKRFCVALRYITSHEKVTVSGLARELKSKLGLTRSTCNTYASRILSELSELGIVDREDRGYVLTPRGWYLVYRYFELVGFPEEISREVLLERLRREDRASSLLVPALEVLIEVYSRIVGEEEAEDIEDLYEDFSYYVEYAHEFEERVPEEWSEILDMIVPPVEELPLNTFFEMLRKKLKDEGEITVAAVKDLLKRRAEVLREEAEKLEREAARRKELASEIKRLVDELR